MQPCCCGQLPHRRSDCPTPGRNDLCNEGSSQTTRPQHLRWQGFWSGPNDPLRGPRRQPCLTRAHRVRCTQRQLPQPDFRWDYCSTGYPALQAKAPSSTPTAPASAMLPLRPLRARNRHLLSGRTVPALRPQARPRIVCSTPPLLKLQRETPCNRAPLSSLASTDGTVTRRQALQHARTPGSNPSIIKGRSFRDALAGSGDTTSDAAPCPATSAPVVPTTTTTAPLSATAQPAPTVVEKRSTVTDTARFFATAGSRHRQHKHDDGARCCNLAAT